MASRYQLAVLALLLLALIAPVHVRASRRRPSTQTSKPKHLFIGEPTSPAALQKYYGKTQWRNSSEAASSGKPYQVLVCGYHNTGTSIITRVMMLMGVWAGFPNELWLSTTNPLKYFERKEVLKLEDALISPSSSWTVSGRNMSQPPTASIKIARWLGAGFNVNNTKEPDVAKVKDGIRTLATKLNQHTPWLVKDPRLCLSSPVWVKTLDAPMCIIIFKNPREVAYRLSLHSLKSFQNINKEVKVYTAPLHLDAWANYTLHALRGCSGKPTVIFPSTLLSSRATVEIATSLLYDQLQQAGLSDLHLPAYEHLYSEVLQYAMTRKEDDDMRFDSGHKNPSIIFDKQLMGTNMLWTPDRPDAPWMEPTKVAYDAQKEALVSAMQRYMVDRYVKAQTIPSKEVADTVLYYMEKHLAGEKWAWPV